MAALEAMMGGEEKELRGGEGDKKIRERTQKARGGWSEGGHSRRVRLRGNMEPNDLPTTLMRVSHAKITC